MHEREARKRSKMETKERKREFFFAGMELLCSSGDLGKLNSEHLLEPFNFLYNSR
jgi:hypothetical protein